MRTGPREGSGRTPALGPFSTTSAAGGAAKEKQSPKHSRAFREVSVRAGAMSLDFVAVWISRGLPGSNPGQLPDKRQACHPDGVRLRQFREPQNNRDAQVLRNQAKPSREMQTGWRPKGFAKRKRSNMNPRNRVCRREDTRLTTHENL